MTRHVSPRSSEGSISNKGVSSFTAQESFLEDGVDGLDRSAGILAVEIEEAEDDEEE